MEENKIKIYSESASIILIKNEKIHSFTKTSKILQEINSFNPSPDSKENIIY